MARIMTQILVKVHTQPNGGGNHIVGDPGRSGAHAVEQFLNRKAVFPGQHLGFGFGAFSFFIGFLNEFIRAPAEFTQMESSSKCYSHEDQSENNQNGNQANGQDMRCAE
jgi:hypothetical protein